VPITYLDSSALVKLVVDEDESAALQAYLDATRAALASSVVAEIELVRTVRRVHGMSSPEEERARSLVYRLALIELDDVVVDQSIGAEPSTLTSLDAIHLASALSVAGDLSAFVAYDRRLLAAAEAAGLSLETPGLTA
jgi:uncharacterized protein